MPLYEYQCTACGHRFERLGKMNEDPPPCPRLKGPGANTTAWQEFFARALRAFLQAKEVEYPGTGELVGPDFEHTIIHLDGSIGGGPRSRTETKTLAEWLDGMTHCGGKTIRLISRSEFVLKGGGWAKDGYQS